MKTIIFFFFLTCIALHSYSQLDKLNGTWISKNSDIIHIEDTIGSFNPRSLSKTKRAFTNSKNYLWNNAEQKTGCGLVINADTLLFISESIINSGKRNCKVIRKEIKCVVLKLNEQVLSIAPMSKDTQAFFKGMPTIDFRKQPAEPDTSIKLEKIIFHTGACLGSCPTIHLQIDAKKNVNYFAESVYKKGSRIKDSSAIGYYKGLMSTINYNKLTMLVQSTHLDTLTYKEVKCCDASLKTIIIYYNNGQSKRITSMFLPQVMSPLVQFLNDTKDKTKLKKTKEKFQFEK